MKSYLTTTHEKFGVIEKVDCLVGPCYVVGDIDILSLIQQQNPHLVSFDFDGERAYTEHPEELAKVAATKKNYKLVFIV
jgi:hypothetical protein